VFHDRGVSVVSAGLLLAVTNTFAVASALVTPWIAPRLGGCPCRGARSCSACRDRAGGPSLRPAPRRHALGSTARLRSRIDDQSGALGDGAQVQQPGRGHGAFGMAQGVGYLIAAVGPTLVGALYDVAPQLEPASGGASRAPRLASRRRLSRSPRPARHRCGRARVPAPEPSRSNGGDPLRVPAVHTAGKMKGFSSRKAAGSRWSGTPW